MTNNADPTFSSLVTPTSLRLSLSAPRSPPYGTLHRLVLTKRRRRGSNPFLLLNDSDDYEKVIRDNGGDSNKILDEHDLSLLQSRIKLLRFLPNLHLSNHDGDGAALPHLPHPHLPDAISGSDAITQWIGVHLLSTKRQNKWRDEGVFRSISDTLVTLSAPALALMEPRVIKTFINLTGRLQIFHYSSKHPMHQTHFLTPSSRNENNVNSSGVTKQRHTRHSGSLLIFVHGGAWGSGKPWMYRLVARPFLQCGMAVAIVGYRTYPDANAQGQIDDVRLAIHDLKHRPETRHYFVHQARQDPSRHPLHHQRTSNIFLAGHSSGAHIALLMLVQDVQRQLSRKENNIATSRSQQSFRKSSTLSSEVYSSSSSMFRAFIGLSGPYDISHHFDFEAARGVEELSPMKPSCGYTRANFDKHSPALCFKRSLHTTEESMASRCFPPNILLVHGMEDSTVPFTATSEAVSILQSCGISQVDEIYLPQTQHQDTVMHLMMNDGTTCSEVLNWITNISDNKDREENTEMMSSPIRSKL